MIFRKSEGSLKAMVGKPKIKLKEKGIFKKKSAKRLAVIFTTAKRRAGKTAASTNLRRIFDCRMAVGVESQPWF